jgi:hypothetical protein
MCTRQAQIVKDMKTILRLTIAAGLASQLAFASQGSIDQPNLATCTAPERVEEATRELADVLPADPSLPKPANVSSMHNETTNASTVAPKAPAENDASSALLSKFAEDQQALQPTLTEVFQNVRLQGSEHKSGQRLNADPARALKAVERSSYEQALHARPWAVRMSQTNRVLKNMLVQTSDLLHE